MKHIKFSLLVMTLMTLSSTARAERPGDTNPYAFIAQLGQITFGQDGGAYLPLSVLNGMRQGNISPMFQFVLANNLMTQCTAEVVKRPPDIRDPYQVAAAKFNYGMCRIKKCFQQGMLMMILPQLSGGSSASQSSAQQQGQIFAQAFQKDEMCDGQGNGIDPYLLSVLLGQ